MTNFEIATLAGQYLIGLGQIAVVWYGIRCMVQANEARGRDHAATVKQQEQSSQLRHEEAMTALKALIERTGLRAEGELTVNSH